MTRIKTMLMALLAITAIGALGAGVASAQDGSGRVSIPAGGCDFVYEGGGWSDNGDGSYSTETDSVEAQTGGDCDVDSVEGEAAITKTPVDPETGIGNATLTGTFSFRVLSGLVTCTYTAALNGTWHWTDHWAAPGPPATDPDIPHNNANINNPGDPANDDKMFHFAGNVTRISGSALFCPTPVAATIDIRDHYNH